MIFLLLLLLLDKISYFTLRLRGLFKWVVCINVLRRGNKSRSNLWADLSSRARLSSWLFWTVASSTAISPRSSSVCFSSSPTLRWLACTSLFSVATFSFRAVTCELILASASSLRFTCSSLALFSASCGRKRWSHHDQCSESRATLNALNLNHSEWQWWQMDVPTCPGPPWFGRGAAPPSAACRPWWLGAPSSLLPGSSVLPLSDPAAPASVGSTAVWLPATRPAPESQPTHSLMHLSTLLVKT